MGIIKIFGCLASKKTSMDAWMFAWMSFWMSFFLGVCETSKSHERHPKPLFKRILNIQKNILAYAGARARIYMDFLYPVGIYKKSNVNSFGCHENIQALDVMAYARACSLRARSLPNIHA